MMHLFVWAIIRAVYITIYSRSQHTVIQSRVENSLFILVGSIYLYLGKFLAPHIFSLFQICIEVIVECFSLQVLSSTFHAYSRDSSCQCDLLIFFSCVIEAGDNSSSDALAVFLDSRRVNCHCIERTWETGTEINLLSACPTVWIAISPDSNRVDRFDMRILCRIPVHSLWQVQEDDCFSFRECITLYTATLCSSQFHIDIIIVQLYLIISGISTFVGMWKFRMNTQRSFSFFIRKRNRHERNVVKIARACTREMRMAESGNRTVRIEISGNSVPSRQSIVRTELHHSKGNLSTRISISCKVSSDKRIDVLSVIFCHVRRLVRWCTCGKCQNCLQSHNISIWFVNITRNKRKTLISLVHFSQIVTFAHRLALKY